MQPKHHRLLWQHNEKLILRLKETCNSHYDWIIIITFYAALHKMAILIHFKKPDFDKQFNYINHQIFNNLVHKYYNDIFAEYNNLYKISRKLRYFQTNINVITDEKLENYLNIWFDKIKPYKI